MDSFAYSYMTLLEYETSLVYESLVEKCRDPRVKLLLVSIYEDTKKHANVLKAVCEDLGQTYPPPMTRSQAEMGSMYVNSLRHVRSIKDEMKNGMSLHEALEAITKDEKAIGEEYVNLLQSKLRAVDEYNTAVKRILTDIAADEEKHQELLKLITDSKSQ